MESHSHSPWDPKSLQDLRSYQLADVSFDLAAGKARFIFINAAGEQREVLLQNLLQFSLSRHPDEEGPFVVDVDISETEAGGRTVLKKLGFGFTDRQGQPVTATDNRLYHVHLEGDIVLDAVCGMAPTRVSDG